MLLYLDSTFLRVAIERQQKGPKLLVQRTMELQVVRRTLPIQKNTKRNLPHDSSNTGGSKIKNQPDRGAVADFQKVTLINHLMIFFSYFLILVKLMLIRRNKIMLCSHSPPYLHYLKPSLK